MYGSARGIERDGGAARSRWIDEWMPAEDVYVAAMRPDAAAMLVVGGQRPTGIHPRRDVAILEARPPLDGLLSGSDRLIACPKKEYPVSPMMGVRRNTGSPRSLTTGWLGLALAFAMLAGACGSDDGTAPRLRARPLPPRLP